MGPIAYDIAVKHVGELVTSALPDAPVVPDPAPREPRLRVTIAAALRASARRRTRLANRLDPGARVVGQPG
jgi:hypothetical protein